MERTERIYKIDHLLKAKSSISLQAIVDALEVSTATVKRDIEYLRDRLNAPIEWDRISRGYRYQAGAQFNLPGVWFSASELHALLTCHHLLASLQPGLLEPHIHPLQQRLREILDESDHGWEEVNRRVRILAHASRRAPSEHFTAVSSALLSRKRLRMHYLARANGEFTRREVSPQRLVYYRDNWYLDAWCHLREQLRSFALDALQTAHGLDQPALDVPGNELDAHFASAYGIFAGPSIHTAILRFTPERARWVSQEHWHSSQHGRFDEQGHYLLDIPYSDSRELVMDILKYGPDVEVLGPPSLREEIAARLEAAQKIYRNGG